MRPSPETICRLLLSASRVRLSSSTGGSPVGQSFGGASRNEYALQPNWAQGDLNSDGQGDLAAHVVLRTGGSGVFHYIIPVYNNNGEPVAQQAVFLGDRIVLENIAISNGAIEVLMLDRSSEDPYTVLTQRTTLEIDASESPPLVNTLAIDYLEEAPQSAP